MSTTLLAEPRASNATPPTLGRLDYLDNLRSFIIVLVVVFHAAMSYMLFAPTWWYVVDTRQSLGFFCFVMITDVFIMPTMFLLAGYFALPSLLRKGDDGFTREKLKRVGIPWVVGTLFLAPVTTYFIWLSRTKTPPPYLHFWTHTFFSTYYEQAQFWFLGVLLLFYFGLMIANHGNARLRRMEPGTGRPGLWFFPAFVAVNALVFLAVNQYVIDYTWVPLSYLLVIQPTRFSLYIFYFALGVHAYRRAMVHRRRIPPAHRDLAAAEPAAGRGVHDVQAGVRIEARPVEIPRGQRSAALRVLPGVSIRADRPVRETGESQLGAVARAGQKFVCHLLRAHGDRASGGADDSATAVEHPREVRGDGDAVAADFVCGVGVRRVADATVRDGEKTCRRLKPASLFSARLPTASAVG